MLGMPGETQQTAQETGAFVGKISSVLGVHLKLLEYDLFYALPLPGTPLYEYGIQVGFIDGSVDGVEDYMESVTNAGAYKRFFMNVNGAHISEVLSWDWIVKLESSRIFRKYKKAPTNLFVINKIKESNREGTINVYKEDRQKEYKDESVYREDTEMGYESLRNRRLKQNPHFKLKYNKIKFTLITEFLDKKIVGNAFVDKIPRKILFPLVKYSVYFEFLIQSIFESNREHNIFKGKSRNANLPRFDDFVKEKFKRNIDYSLRKIVNRNSCDLNELPTITEKSRRLLLRGL